MSATSVRCPDCRAIDAFPVLMGAALDLRDDPWTKSDRDWFAARPRRRLRLQEVWPGELAAGKVDNHTGQADDGADFIAEVERRGMTACIAVVQFGPGKRWRRLVAPQTNDPLYSYTDAGILRLLPSLAAILTSADPAPTAADVARIEQARIDKRMGVFASFLRQGVNL